MHTTYIYNVFTFIADIQTNLAYELERLKDIL